MDCKLMYMDCKLMYMDCELLHGYLIIAKIVKSLDVIASSFVHIDIFREASICTSWSTFNAKFVLNICYHKTSG